MIAVNNSFQPIKYVVTYSVSMWQPETKRESTKTWNHFPHYWPLVRGIHRSPVHSPNKWPVTRSFDVFFDLRLNKRLIKPSRHWWFETPSRSLWCHCNGDFFRKELIMIHSNFDVTSAFLSSLFHWDAMLFLFAEHRGGFAYSSSGKWVCVFIRPFEKGTYYAVAMSVRLSVRPSVRPSEFSGLFSTCFEISIWKLVSCIQ